MFVNSCAIRQAIPGPDPLEFLEKLQDSVRSEKGRRVFGLTSNSNRFLIEQTLAPLGYRRTYSGEHRYKDDRLSHTFDGPHSSLERVVSGVTDSGSNWAAFLANSLEEFVAHDKLGGRMSVDVAARRPINSTGFLCSWLLQRV